MREPSDAAVPGATGFGTPGTDQTQPGVFGFGRPKPSPQEVAFFHEGADTDQGNGAKHHTLGDRPGQAFPGSRGKAVEEAADALDDRLDTAEADIDDLELGYILRQRIIYTATDTFTKASYPWLRAYRVRLAGSGGAGGGQTGASTVQGRAGGGYGGLVEKFSTDIAGLATTENITIGNAGTGGTGTGGAGGDVVAFGCTGSGGGGGGATPGAGGAAAGGDLNVPGQPGGIGSLASFSAVALAGAGGSGQFGAGGGALLVSGGSSAGNAATGYGAGGGGGARATGSSAFNGGNGSKGIVILELFA